MPACPRCAELEERIRQLENELTGDWQPPIEWDITRVQRIILSALVKREAATRQALRLLLGNDEAAVQIFYLRRWLRPRGVEIRNRYGVGWWMTKEDKAKLKAMA